MDRTARDLRRRIQQHIGIMEIIADNLDNGVVMERMFNQAVDFLSRLEADFLAFAEEVQQ